MKPSLLTKLRMMNETEPRHQEPASPFASPPEASPEPRRNFYSTCATFPLSSFCDRGHATAENLSLIFGIPFSKGIKEKDFLFLDTETTGLSGGVGTLAFQIGLGYIKDNRFVVEQFLMRDYHEEPAMLLELAARCSRFPVIVTFNGRTFDVPLLKSRLRMNRQNADCLPALHADLLFPARRLWKLRLGSCKLGHLEEALLGVRREDDLAGALVPQTYFQYLKDRRFGPIQRVLTHNQQDIISLAQLFFFLCRQYQKPESIQHGQDLLSMARSHEKQGHAEQALKCYRLSAKGSTWAEAFEAMASHEKRKGNAKNAMRLYQAMAKRGEHVVFAYEALAKLCEHQTGDLRQALHYTRQALLFLAEPSLFPTEAVQSQRIALQYRYARLLRKEEKYTSHQEENP